jgi:hypothetical protein
MNATAVPDVIRIVTFDATAECLWRPFELQIVAVRNVVTEPR